MESRFVFSHSWQSSCSWRVRWALAIKGIAHREIVIDLAADENNAPSHVARNPMATVPTLEVDGAPIFESLAIIEYLDHHYPDPPLIPKERSEEIRARQLALLIAAGVQPLQNQGVLAKLPGDASERQVWARHWIDKGLAAYEKILERQPLSSFSVGSELTMADICLIPQIYNGLGFGCKVDTSTRIWKIYKHCLEREDCVNSSPLGHPGRHIA